MKNSITTSLQISDIAWTNGNRIGTLHSPETELKKDNIFHREFKNFRRLDPASKAVSAAVAMILHNQGLYPEQEKVNIPIFFSSSSGPLYSDYAYYNDFLQFGETAGRANLFVYTLPSSPLGEASVHCGITGDLLFVNSATPLQTMCNMIADSHHSNSNNDGYIAGMAEEKNGSLNTLFIFFEEQATTEEGLSIKNISQIQESTLNSLKKELMDRFRNDSVT